MASVLQSQSVMVSVLEQLLAALDDLDNDKLKRFQWRLKNYFSVSAADLEKADAPDTVDLMMKCFGPEEAVKITVDILRKMNHNHQAEELENKHKQDTAQAESSKEDPAPARAESNPISDTFTDSDLRKDFLQYSHKFTLDPNTVNNRLLLSERKRVMTNTGGLQLNPDHPDRFDECYQVLCRESVCGHWYREIEWSGLRGVLISVSYKSISRKGGGDECVFGNNDQSWSLICSPSRYSFRHNNIKTVLPVKPISSRIGMDDIDDDDDDDDDDNDYIRKIGVFVDHSAGTLSFYSIYRNTMSLIHTEHTTFTQPLYPGFAVEYGSSVKLCTLKKILNPKT